MHSQFGSILTNCCLKMTWMSMNVRSHSVWNHLFPTLWPRLNITEHCHVYQSHNKKWYLIIILICASVMMSMMKHLSIFVCRWFCFFPENFNSVLIPAKTHLLEKIFSLCFRDTSSFESLIPVSCPFAGFFFFTSGILLFSTMPASSCLLSTVRTLSLGFHCFLHLLCSRHSIRHL